MESRHNRYTLYNLLYNFPEIFIFIFFNLNDDNLRYAMLVCTYFNKLIRQSGLLNRPQWKGVNYREIIAFQDLALPSNLYQPYSLHNGAIAFGLNKNYVWHYNNNNYLPQNVRANSFRPYPDWKNHQAILVFFPHLKQPIPLIGHEGSIIHVIQHNANTIASIGTDNTIRIWEKLTGNQKCMISLNEKFKNNANINTNRNAKANANNNVDANNNVNANSNVDANNNANANSKANANANNKANTNRNTNANTNVNPLYLLALNNQELACFNVNGTAYAWNITTGELTQELLNFPKHHFINFTQQNGYIIATHSSNGENQYYLIDDLHFSIWNIAEKQTIETLDLINIKTNLLKCIQVNYENIPALPRDIQELTYSFQTHTNYHHGIAIISLSTNTHSLTTFFYDIQNQKSIFAYPNLYLQYKCLSNGNLVILYQTSEGWQLLSQYCFKEKDFKIKFQQTDNRKNIQAKNQAGMIFNNGDILIHDKETGFINQWCLLTQQYLAKILLDPPSIPLHQQTLICLLNGNILACANDGVIAIWDQTTGKLLLNLSLTKIDTEKKPDRTIPNLITDKANCVKKLSNGDIYLKWRETTTPNETWYHDHQHGKLLRFNLFQSSDQIKSINIIKSKQQTSDNKNYSSLDEENEYKSQCKF